MRIHPALWLLYHWFRLLAWTGVHLFFRKITIIGRQHLHVLNGPMIVVVNHPNTLMDVLVPCSHIPRVLYFLANYGLFKNRVVGAILKVLYCIPVKRREDVAEGESRNNDAAFEQSFEHIEKGGALFVAPEGVSWMNRFVRPLKTGTARIALGAESHQNWQLGVRIIPVGLSYSAPDRFRSKVVMKVGEPVTVAKWQSDYEQDPVNASELLTLHLEDTLKNLTIHTRDEQGEQLVTRWESMLQNSSPLSAINDFRRTKQVTSLIDYEPIVSQTTTYFQQLEQTGVNDLGVAALQKSAWRIALDAFILTIGFSFFLAGWLLWLLPTLIPKLIAKALRLYIGYDSTVKLLAGLFVTFPVALWLFWRWCGAHCTEQWHFWPMLGIIIVLGWVAELYSDVAKRFLSAMKVAWMPENQRKQLMEMRSRLMTHLEQLSADDKSGSHSE